MFYLYLIQVVKKSPDQLRTEVDSLLLHGVDQMRCRADVSSSLISTENP
jgi:hypothetical protein